MRILHLSNDGLPDWRVEKAALSASKRGHEVTFGGRESRDYKGDTFSKIYEINWSSKARMGIPFYWNSVKKQTEKVIQETRPDIIHAHNIFSAKMVSEIKRPFIYDDHEYWSMHSRLLPEMSKATWENRPEQGFKQLLELYRRVKKMLRDSRLMRIWSNWEKELVSYHPTITVSEKIAEELIKIGNNSNKIFVVPNFPTWSEVKDFQAPQFHDRLSSVYAGSDGRNREKFPNRNIDGLADLFEREEIGDLAFLGWEEQSSSTRIKYFGLLSRQAMYNEMFKHSIGLLPFKKHWLHPFLNPNKAYEYAHAGLLLMCTTTLKTVTETLREHCTTFEDYSDLVLQLKYYGENKDELYKKRVNAFEFARKNLTWEKNEENIMRAYQLCR